MKQTLRLLLIAATKLAILAVASKSLKLVCAITVPEQKLYREG